MLAIVWLITVVLGSIIVVSAVNTGLNEDEVEALLSENERLARATNVAYESANTEIGIKTVTAFPQRLLIPSLGIDLPVSNPTTSNIEALDEELKHASVRYPDSAKLGEDGGNTLLFGHSSRLPVVRNQLYKAFNDIETLNVGDSIEVLSGSDTYTYIVSRVYQANASDDQIALDVEGHRLTLLTCDSFGKKSDRWVVEAEFAGVNI